MGSKSRRIATWVVPTAALSVAVGALGAAPAQAADPDPARVVSVGDSYISGEGGVWANKGFHSAQPSTQWTHWWTGEPSQGGGFYSGFVYGDAGAPAAAGGSAGAPYGSKSARELINYCHRSAWSPVHGNVNEGVASGIGGMVPVNLACSGATVPSHYGSDKTVIKPGVDFNKDGITGQATMLREEAVHHNVQAVVLSVGGNDFGFADIATACITAFIPFLGGENKMCSKLPQYQALIQKPHLDKTKDVIKAGIKNVTDAMRQAGKADKDWQLVYQTPPLPLTRGSDIAKSWDESGFFTRDRQTIGGCGVYTQDANWLVDTVYPTLISTMKQAVAESRGALGDVKVKFVDNTNAFDGHKLCESSIAKINTNYALTAGYGMSKPTDQPRVPFVAQAATPTANDPLTRGFNGAKSEWITPIILGDQPPLGKDQHRAQNPLHPNFWGQRALSACLDLALTADANKIVKCAQDKPGGVEVLDSKGRPQMKITAVEDLPVPTPSAPAITEVKGGDGKLMVSWTAPTQVGTAGAIKDYEYSTDSGTTWKSLGSATPDQPIELTKDSSDQPLVNGVGVTVLLRAVNDGGPGLVSNTGTGMPAGKPQPPTDVVATPIDFGAEINFTRGDTGGPNIPVIDYRYRIVEPAGTWPDDWNSLVGQDEPPLVIQGLEPNVKHKIEIIEVTPGGASDPVSVEFVPGPTGSGYVPIAPTRVYDSRTDDPKGPLDAGSHTVKLNAKAQVVPTDATAVVYNVTATGGTASGFVEVVPVGKASGTTSTLNWRKGETIANAHVVQLAGGAEPEVELAVGSSGTAHVILDVMGYYTKVQPTTGAATQAVAPTGTLFKPLATPLRVLDTRDGQEPTGYPNTDGNPYMPKGKIVGGATADLELKGWFKEGDNSTLAGVSGKDLCRVADGNKVKAVAVNVTVTGTKKSGALVAYGDGAAPTASLINWSADGQTLANGGIVTVGSDCVLHIKNVGNGAASQAHVMVDVMGVFAADSADFTGGQQFFPVQPVRAYDSRDADGPLDDSDYRELLVADKGDVPVGAQSLAYNLTVTGNTESGFISLAPGDVTDWPKASVLNWNAAAGAVTHANGGIVGASGDQAQVNAFVGGTGSTQYLVDIAGYFKEVVPE